MGQQESRASSAAAATDHSVDSQLVASKRSDQCPPPPQGGAGRGKMDKLFRRAQSTLESRMRGRERSNSPQSPSATKQRKGQSASLRVSKPLKSSKLLQSPGGVVVDENDKENVSLSSSLSSQCSTVRTGCDSLSGVWQTSCDSPGSQRLAGQAALENIPCHLTDSPINRGGKADSGTAPHRTIGVSATDETATKSSEQLVPTSLRLSPKSAFMLDNGHQEPAQTLGMSLPHIVVCEQKPLSQSDNNVTSSSPVFKVDSPPWESGKTRPRGRCHSGGSTGGVEVNVSRPTEMEDYLAPKVVPEDCGLSPIEERQEKYSVESYGVSLTKTPMGATGKSCRDASQEFDGQDKEHIKKAHSSKDPRQVTTDNDTRISPSQSGGLRNNMRGNSSEPSSSVCSPTDDVFVDAKSHLTLTETESPYTSAANVRCTGETFGGKNIADCHHPEAPAGAQSKVVLSVRSASLNHIETNSAIHKPIDVSYPVATSRVLGQNHHHHMSMIEMSTSAAYGVSAKRKLTDSEIEKSSRGDILVDNDVVMPPLLNRVLSVDSGLEGATSRHVTDIDDIRFDFSAMATNSVKKSSDTGGKVFTARYNTWVGIDNRDSTPPSTHSDSLQHTRSLQNRRNKKGSKRRRYGSVGGVEGAGQREDRGGMWRPPSRSVSLEEMVKTPKTVPEKLSFRQLEKFEGESVLFDSLDRWSLEPLVHVH